MRKHITVYLHLALAKSVAEYLAAHDGDATAALNAAQRDVVQREGQNSGARAFQRAYTKLVEALKLPVAPEDADAASDAAQAAYRTLSEAGVTNEQLTAALKKAGLDPSKVAEQVAELRTQAAAAAEGAQLKRELAYRDAADALGYDAGRLTKILRDEQGLPVKRSVKVTGEDGQEKEVETWGIPTLDAAGKETAFTALNQHPDVKGFEASLKKTETQQQEQQNPNQQQMFTSPSLPNQRASESNVGGGVKLSGTPSQQLVGGAGSI